MKLQGGLQGTTKEADWEQSSDCCKFWLTKEFVTSYHTNGLFQKLNAPTRRQNIFSAENLGIPTLELFILKKLFNKLGIPTFLKPKQQKF